MDGFSIEFDGLDKLIADLESMGGRIDKDTTTEAFGIIQQATPAGPNARGSWSMTLPTRLSGLISANNKVLWFLEWGTGLFSEAADGKHAKYKIAPINGKALAFHWAGFDGGQRFQIASRVKDGKAVFRSAKGNATVSPKLAGNMAVLKFVMHPGIHPVGMVRGNLPRIREIFERNVQAAADRVIEQFTRGF